MTRLGAALLVAALLGGCTRMAYERNLGLQTRTMKIYQGFSTTLILRGTLLTPAFRETIADERRRLMNPSEANHDIFVARMDDDGAAYHEVVFSADSPQPEGDMFGESDAGWVIRLVADGVEEKLVTTYKVRRPTSLHRALYPHLNIWSDLWIARFDRTVTNPANVEFHVGSGYGNASLTWTDLQEP